MLVSDSPPTRADHETTPVVASTILMASAAILIMGLQPILLGGLAEKGLLSQSGIGVAATLELFGFAVGSTFGPFVMNGRLRLKVFVVSLVLAVVNLAIYLATTSLIVLLQRSFAGVLEGMLIGAASLILTHTSRPERLGGLMTGLGTLPQVAMAYLLPALIIPRFGLNAGFVVLAIFAALSAVSAGAMVDHIKTLHDHNTTRVRWTAPLAGMVALVFLSNFGCSAAWSYMERLGHQARVPSDMMGLALSLSLAIQVAGCLLASWLSWRLPSRSVLIIFNLLEGVIMVGLALSGAPASFLILSLLFGLFWTSQQPFAVNQLILLDPTRRVAVLTTPVTMAGLSMGPIVAGWAMTPTDVHPGFMVAAAASVLGGLILMLPRPRRATPDAGLSAGTSPAAG